MFQKHYLEKDKLCRVISEKFFDEYNDIGVFYEYDPIGNLSSRRLQVPIGYTVFLTEYRYDDAGKLIGEDFEQVRVNIDNIDCRDWHGLSWIAD